MMGSKQLLFVVTIVLGCLLAVAWPRTGPPVADKPESPAGLRPSRIRDFLRTIEGVLIESIPEHLRNKSVDGPRAISKEPPRWRKGKDGYLRFLMAPPGAHFPVRGGRSGDTAEDITQRFLQQNGDLFLCQSPSVGFEVIHSKTTESRSNVHLRQTYSGIEVYGAEMIVQLDAEEKVFAVISDVMRDTEALDTGRVSLKPAIGQAVAQTTAIESAASEYGDFDYEASEPLLMIYAPGVLGYPGDTQLVWIIDVRAGELPFIHEKVLVNAHTDEIALNYSLIRGAFTPKIYDYYEHLYDFSVWEVEHLIDEANIPTSHQDVKDANDVAGDFHDFFNEYHNNFFNEYTTHQFAAEIRVAVRCQDCDATENAYGAVIGIGLMSDDVLVHEFMHSMYSKMPFSCSLNGPDANAMSESFGDLWGEWIDQINGLGNDSNGVKWLFGEDYDWADLADRCFEVGYDADMIAVRCLYDPNRVANILTAAVDGGASPDRLSNRLGPPYSHYLDAGISNKLGYLITDGTSGESGGAFNTYTFSGLGIPTTAQLFFESLVLLPDSPDFNDLGCVMQLAAINNALTESQREIVENACRAVEVYVVDSRFCVRNSSSVPVAWIDELGNLVLTGTLTQNTTPTATGNDEFRLQDSDGNDVAIIDMTNGNMYLAGSVQATWANPSEGSDDFIIKDTTGATVAYIDESGDVYLTGDLYEQAE